MITKNWEALRLVNANGNKADNHGRLRSSTGRARVAFIQYSRITLTQEVITPSDVDAQDTTPRK